MGKKQPASGKTKEAVVNGGLVLLVIILGGVLVSRLAQGSNPVTEQASSLMMVSPEAPLVDTAAPPAFEQVTENAASASLDTQTPSPLLGEVATATPSATATNTAFVTQTMYVSSTGLINVRACERRACNAITSLSPGVEVDVIGQIQGDSVSGDSLWYQVMIDGEIAYIHSSLLSRNPVATQQSELNPSSAPSPYDPWHQPSLISTPVPQPQNAGYTCDCSRTCNQIPTCEEAYFQLRTCGCTGRDGDSDGIPCENFCR